jgi:hypothetical protein
MPKDNKTGLIVFRLPESLTKKLDAEFEEKKVLDVKSNHQFARKIITDYLSGRLIYIDASSVSDNALLRAKAG